MAILVACSQELGKTTGTPIKTPTTLVTPVPTTILTPVDDTNSPQATETTKRPTSARPTSQSSPAIEARIDTVPSVTPSPRTPGALIQVAMESHVGVLLDELPADLRDQVVASLLEQPDKYWLERAKRQVRLSRNRLNFRNFIYDEKGQLPLPPEQRWSLSLDPAGPSRQTIQGHDLVLVGYTFASTLLTDIESPGLAEPVLSDAGGVWQEPFVFPADPDLLLQRTGNACVNEGGFPPNSFDSENVWIFYDYACQASSGGAAGCHRTRLPRLSCREALEATVGEVETTMRFERIAWDSDLADDVRLGSFADIDSPDLMAVGKDLETNRIIYRYIDPENCALDEGSVGGSGWRRLLQFSATVHNVGGQPLNIGPVVAEDPINHVFSYDPCHDHFHYSNYGEFSLGTSDQRQSSKQAFCVQSTSRFSNNETTPLTHNYSCRFQGIQAGWADEYVAGLDSQWIDITEIGTPSDGLALELGFVSNSDRFLCEGQVVLDDDKVVWEPSGFTTEDGESINRPKCDFFPDWDRNNRASRNVFIPQTGSFVTEPCTNFELGPVRNCGFTELTDDNLTCISGFLIERTFRPEDPATPQILRVCERSAVLGSGLACTFEDSLLNIIIGDDPIEASFTCPSVRDAKEIEGGYSLFIAPFWLPVSGSEIVVPVE